MPQHNSFRILLCFHFSYVCELLRFNIDEVRDIHETILFVPGNNDGNVSAEHKRDSLEFYHTSQHE